MIYIKSLAEQIHIKVIKALKTKFQKRVIYFLRFSKKLERYNKRYLIYTKNESIYLRKKK